MIRIRKLHLSQRKLFKWVDLRVQKGAGLCLESEKQNLKADTVFKREPVKELEDGTTFW